jgi:hypothetical protein
MRSGPSGAVPADGPNGSEEPVLVSWAEARAQWRSLAQQCGETNIFHGERWIQVLEQAYGFELSVAAVVERSGEFLAALPLARSKNPFRRAMIALPFSDSCPPLALSAHLAQNLVSNLTGLGIAPRRFEIRDFEGPPPWHTFDNFVSWELDVERPVAVIERRFSGSFRRSVRAALDAGVHVQREQGLAAVKHFYRLMAGARQRLGLPVQPLRFFQTVCRIFGEDAELWFASKDSRNLAAIFVLRDGKTLYTKWFARRAVGPRGSIHLLLRTAIEEHHKSFNCLDLGRNDSRNDGLNQFKRSLGARVRKVPCTFFPKMPSQVSSEHIDGTWRIVQQLWAQLPTALTDALGSAVYKYLA